MKRLHTAILFFALTCAAASAQGVSFVVNGGIDEGKTRSTIESGLSLLLSRMGEAQESGSSVDFTSISISSSAKESIEMLWKNVPFVCEEEEVVEPVLTTADGYQVRNIPLELKSADGAEIEDSYQEAVIDFDRNGTIQSFYFAINVNLYRQIISKGSDVGDLRRRQMILDYVEHFRTAYNQKDLEFLKQVFSDDALIITGKVVKSAPSDLNPMPSEKIIYNTHNKTQYLARLQTTFKNAKYIKVTFSEIKVKRHPAKKDFYGVLLRQGYDSGNYSDDGYVFLLWDFRDETHPQIHVRTWQPYFVDEDNGVVIDEGEIFDISSFDL